MTSLEKKALKETIKDIIRGGVILLLMIGWGLFCINLPGSWRLIIFAPAFIILAIVLSISIFEHHLYIFEESSKEHERI